MHDHLNKLSKTTEPPIFIKQAGDKTGLNKKIKDLNDDFGIDVTKRIWRQLWDYIWGGTLEDNKKFENFNKVLLAKLYDEKTTKPNTAYTFQRTFTQNQPQTDQALAHQIDLLYRQAYREYSSKNQAMDLKNIKGINFNEFSPYLVCQCVELLQSFSFHNNKYKHIDVLGEFYEMVIRDAFKQTKGLFLTHPNIVLFIIAALDVEEQIKEHLQKPPKDNKISLPLVIDPSCGTGTFLVHYMHYVQKLIASHQPTLSETYLWDMDCLYGIDNEAVLATACQINLILQGNGNSHIYHADGLSDFKEVSQLGKEHQTGLSSINIKEKTNYYNKPAINKFDFILSNPPFNVTINKNNMLNHFSIKGKSEAYFLERWYQLLKPGGRIGVVLPESFFSVEDDIEGRFFLYRHFNIRAIVSLPSHAFLPHTPTSTSILLASKKTVSEENQFNTLWNQYSLQFEKKKINIFKLLPEQKSSINFNTNKTIKNNNIRQLIKKIEMKCQHELATNFVVFPFFEADFISNENNYIKIIKYIQDTISAVKNRWILNRVSHQQPTAFFNFSVDEVGYKAGKKGSKDRPNELMSLFDINNNKIYNIKYAHSWHKLDINDNNTVLRQIKERQIWQ